jgi:HEAT repeat protein
MKWLCKVVVALTPLLLGWAVPAEGENKSPAPKPDQAQAEDEKLLARAGLKTDTASVLAFFRKRSPTEADHREMARLVRQLGHDRFELREEAAEALRTWGVPALEHLRKALNDPDAEVVRGARACIEEVEGGPGSLLPCAAARILVQRRAPGAVGVLLDYLPFADDDSVVEEVYNCLLAFGSETDRPDAKLIDALTDARPVLRGAAGHVLGRRGSAEEREAVVRLLADPNPHVRFRAARALLKRQDRRVLPALVGLIGEGPLDLAWQTEDILIALAGDGAPAVSVSAGGEDGRRKALAAWQTWNKAHGQEANLARYEESQRLLGLTLGIEYNTGRVWECRMDGALAWELRDLKGPMEAQILPGGRILVAEKGAQNISERDTRGTVLWKKEIGADPTGVQRLPNGNTFVSTYTWAMEFDKTGAHIYKVPIAVGSNAICKHRNGNIIFATDIELVEMDSQGKKLRSVPLPRDGMWVGLRDLPNDRFLLANSTSGRVLEVDQTGKILWETKVPGACGVERLPSGNTLVATSGRVVEFNRAGREVWEKKSEGYVRRIHRR